MKPRLAHHTPSKTEIDDRELFRWDAETTDQFVLVDPLNQGWVLVAEGAKGNIPAHLLLRAPLVWSGSAGPVFVLVRRELSRDHEVHSVHDLPDNAIVGNVDRYVSPEEFLATCREKGRVRVVAYDAGVPEELLTYPSDDSDIAQTTSRCVGGLVSLDGISKVGLYDKPHMAESSKTVGLVVYLTGEGTHGGEAIRVFDFYVEKVR